MARESIGGDVFSAVERRRSVCRSCSVAAGLTCLIAGAVVLAGWALDIEFLKSVLPNTVSMKANTALALALTGLALLGLRETPPFSRRIRMGAGLCSLAVGLVGLLTLVEYATGWDLGIDQALFRESAAAVGTSHPGRMAPPTALCFLLLGTAGLLSDRETRRGFRPAEPLALFAAIIAFTAFTGYMFGVRALTGPTRYTLMAVHTSVLIMVAAAGLLLARPAGGWVSVVSDDGAAGLMARWLAPALAVLMTALGWFRVTGEKAGAFTPEVGTALFNVVRVVSLGIVVFVVANMVKRLESVRNKALADLGDLNLGLEQRVRERTAEISRAHDELKAQRDLVSTILDVVGALVVVMDREGRITRFNRMCEQVTGYTAAEVNGRPFWDIFLLPEETDAVKALFLKLRSGDFPMNHENFWLTKAGGRRLIAWSNSCVPGAGGEVMHIIGTGIDVTDGRAAEAEIRRLNADLERRILERTAELEGARARLEASNRELEQFAYVASHDLQEPLRKITAFGELLREQAGTAIGAGAADHLNRMLGAARRMHDLINDLLSLSRVDSGEKQAFAVDLNQTVMEVLGDLETRIKEAGARLDVGSLPTIEADAMQMHQLFQNLIGNAVKFRRSDVPPEIMVWAPDPAPGDKTAADGFAVVCVKDNGIGFENRYAEQIFGVFRRLHARGAYEGTGIGLAVCRRIVQRHNGSISARGRPGEGAEFTVRLPLKQRRVDQREEAGE